MPYKIQDGDLIGAVLLGGKWQFFAATCGEWILDYPSYSGEEAPADFRGGLAIVHRHSGGEFVKALSEGALDAPEIRRAVTNDGYGLTFLVDFDHGVFINEESNLPLETYVPSNWKGIYGNPIEHIPEHFREMFNRR